MALTERQQQRLQVCENNWVRRIVGVKRVDRRRMDELRGDWCADELDGEIGGMPAEMGWALGVDGGRENGRVDRLKKQGRRKRGRPRLR